MNMLNTNIENLTELWRVAGQNAGCHMITSSYEISEVAGSEWPNRLWFKGKLKDSELADLVGQFEIPLWKRMKQFNKIEIARFTLPLWGTFLKENETILQDHGFRLKSVQYGMSLDLDHEALVKGSHVSLIAVDTPALASEWARAFQKSFGYIIHPDTVVKTMRAVTYYVVRHNEETIGTAAIFYSHNHTAGIHSMGILPEMRRQGYAGDLLTLLLSLSKLNGARNATLQASESGRRLYLKAGFREEFIIKNYFKNDHL